MTEPDPISEGVELSRVRARAWHPRRQVLYAALVTLGWLVILGVAIFIVTLLTGGATFESPALKVALGAVAVIGVVVMTWLLWNFAISSMADLATGGTFSRYRKERLVRFDKYFSRIALGTLLLIPFIPVVQLFE